VAAFDKVKDVFFGNTAIFATAWHLVDIDVLFLGKVSNSWSRQGSSTRAFISAVITWGCRRCFVLHLVLGWHVGSNWLRSRRLDLSCRLCCSFSRPITFLVNSKDHMADWNDVVVAEVDLLNLTRRR